ncbi:trypsin-like peptidase domain-containing protein [Streptomyces sp. NPDC093707]|uniref:S1C family serine protease n=1 Tax=Streptomyces sp. NPDC093707 TaxID=3154984 RepID=UPI00344EE991
MDDAKAAGPKLKWWSRPERAPGPGRPAGAESGGPAAGASGEDASGDWIVRPPQPAPAEAAVPPVPAAAEAAVPPIPAPADAAVPPAGAPQDPRDAHAGQAAQVAGGAGELTAASAEISRPASVASVPASGPAGAAPAAAAVPEQAPSAAAARPDEDAPAAAERPAATMLLGAAPAGAAAQRQPAPGPVPTAGGSRPDPRTEPAAVSGPAADAASAAPAGDDAPRQRPLHPEDPYGTPPYGGPGPWAPAPLVQRPTATPAHGTALPPAHGAAAPGATAQVPAVPHDAEHRPAAGPVAPEPGFAPGPDATGPRPAVAEPATGGFVPHPGDGGPRPAPPAAPGAWQHYDPWGAPRPGGPVAGPAAPGPRRRRRAALAAGAAVVALLAGGLGGVAGAYIERYGGINDIQLPQVAGGEGGRSPGSVAGIARAALPGVVTLHVRGNAEQGTGTGFVLDREGHILTNNHVVEPAGTGGEISVTFSGGQTARAKVIGQDGGYDLAVVQVEGVTGLHPLTLGDSDTAQVGDPVVAIGAPYDLANTVTSGIISAKQRPITAGGKKSDGSDVSYVDALQTDAPINPGNSGGPLVDAKARVIGINSAIRAADSGGGSSGGLDGGGQGGSIGLGFAIPINQAKRVAEELINTGKATHPVLGVTLEMEYAGDGARIGAGGKGGPSPVLPGGPGAKAGLRPGDVITKVDGVAVHSGEELIIKVRSHRPGDVLTLTVQRGGGERPVRLTLGSSRQG